MMSKEQVEGIQNDPNYIELLKKRTGFAWMLSIIMLGVYYGYILVIAFNKESLHTPVSEGSLMTVGMPIGVAIILFAFMLTGVYVRRANSEFDELTQKIKDKAEGK